MACLAQSEHLNKLYSSFEDPVKHKSLIMQVSFAATSIRCRQSYTRVYGL
jgi:hypothetical protein